MTTEKSARLAWEEGYYQGYKDGERLAFYDATQNPYVDESLDPAPFLWNDRGIEHRLPRTKPEWDVPPNHNPYSFKPRPGYSQSREDYA